MSQFVVSALTSAFDDWQFAEDGDVQSPGGRAVADWLARSLDAETQVEMHSTYGWCFDVATDDGPVWIMMANGPEESEVYFWAEHRPSIWKTLMGRGKAPHRPTLEEISRQLTGDARFSNVRIVQPGQ